jgi:protein-S-isoprenylcysteine O-methyltransferase Ste14
MQRWTVLAYGVTTYLLFLATIAYSVAFFGNLFVGRTIDAAATIPLVQALLANVGLLLLFGLQHSGMARPRFKLWLARFVDPVAERSTFVLMSSITMIVLMVLWQPLGGVAWSVENVIAKHVITFVYFVGWAMMIWATFLLDHYEMFGLRQVWCAFRDGRNCAEPAFQTPAAYRYLRHPIYAGWLIILWAAPIMTIAHLVLAVGLTIYVLCGIQLEERDLEERLPYYEQYRRKVPMLLPSLRRRLTGEASASETRP